MEAHDAIASDDRIRYRSTSWPSALANRFAIGAVCDSPEKNRPTDIAVVLARRARSFRSQPFAAMSSSMRRPLNRIGVAPIGSKDYGNTAPNVNNKKARPLTLGASAPVPSLAMPERPRPIFHPEIGAFFVSLRERKGWKQSQAEDIAARKKLTVLTHQVLWRLEQGKVKNIEPEVLRAIAKLYQTPYEDLVARWTSYRYGVRIDAGARADSSHKKNRPFVTLSDTPSEVEDPHTSSPTSSGGIRDAQGPEPATGHNESESTLDAEVHRGVVQERNRIERELLESLYASADQVRTVADALLGRRRPPPPGTASASDRGRPSPIHRPANRGAGRS